MDWLDVVQYYRELIDDRGHNFEPMLDLVTKIEKSAYANGIVPRLSMFSLYIAQSDIALYHHHFPKLKIDYDTRKEEFRFTYEDGYMDKKWWRRTARSDEGFEVLERFFLKRARWFKKVSCG